MTATDVQPRRGEIYWLDWNPARGSEEAGVRPAVIVQSDPLNVNPRYPNTVVVAVSSRGRNVPTHVAIESNKMSGLDRNSFVKCEQLQTVSKERLGGRIGSVSNGEMNAISDALVRTLALT